MWTNFSSFQSQFYVYSDIFFFLYDKQYNTYVSAWLHKYQKCWFKIVETY